MASMDGAVVRRQGDDYAAAFARLAIFATLARLQLIAPDPALIIRSPSPRPPLHAAASKGSRRSSTRITCVAVFGVW